MKDNIIKSMRVPLRLIVNNTGDLELRLGLTCLLICRTGTYAASLDGKWSIDARDKKIWVTGPGFGTYDSISKLDMGIKRNVILCEDYNENGYDWKFLVVSLCCCIGCCVIFK
jgi:hypothetical protein